MTTTRERPLVFLDTETTGLDYDRHHAWEVAWAINDGPIRTAQVPHTLADADPVALRINGYLDRVDPDQDRVSMDWDCQHKPSLCKAVAGAHIVGSNPPFDANQLARWFPTRPWHYRMIDLAPMAMVLFGWDRPRGMADIRNTLVDDWGHNIPEGDHTAAGDVDTLRACYYAITHMARALRDGAA